MSKPMPTKLGDPSRRDLNPEPSVLNRHGALGVFDGKLPAAWNQGTPWVARDGAAMI